MLSIQFHSLVLQLIAQGTCQEQQEHIIKFIVNYNTYGIPMQGLSFI